MPRWYLDKLMDIGILRVVSFDVNEGIKHYALAVPTEDFVNSVIDYVVKLVRPTFNEVVEGLRRGCYLAVKGEHGHVYLMIRCRGGEPRVNVADLRLHRQ